MNAFTRKAIWISIVGAQLAFNAWIFLHTKEQERLLGLVNASLRGAQQERAHEVRYTTQIHQGWVFRSQPRTGEVEMFNPKSREWVALGSPGWLPPNENPLNWGDEPVKSSAVPADP